VLKAKELRALRPHGHILRSGRGTSPDEAALHPPPGWAACSIRCSPKGHVSINRLLSTTHGYLGFFRSHGLRVFAEVDGAWTLLDQPSAFEMQPGACRWIYRHAGGTLALRSEAASGRHCMSLNIDVLEGAPQRFLLSHHIALHGDDGAASRSMSFTRDGAGVTIAVASGSELAKRFPTGSFRIAALDGTAFDSVGGDELLFADGASRQQPFVCLVTAHRHRSASLSPATSSTSHPSIRHGPRPPHR
jgi:hypothetical protein